MAEYIEREALFQSIRNLASKSSLGETALPCLNWKEIVSAISDMPVADGAPVKHGHIVWKEYHKGGIRRRKCLQEIKSVYIEQQMPCKNIAIIDERYLSKDPYCSECGKLLGEFLNYCGNCGAKMDGEEE